MGKSVPIDRVVFGRRACRSWAWVRFFLVAPSLLSVSIARAQFCTITFDNTNSAAANAQSVTFPLTVSGANRLLVVQVNVDANDGASSITGAAYGGAPMSQVLQTLRPGGGGGRQATFVLASPALGTHNVVVSLQGTKQMEVGAVDYNGVDPAAPVGATAFVQDANSLDHSLALATTANNSLIVSQFMWYPNNTSLSGLGAGQTQRWAQTGNNGAEGDDKSVLLAGPTTVSYTLANSKPADIQAIEIHPCGILSTPTPTPSNTPTNTPTPTNTLTHTPTSTATNSSSLTPTPTNTATSTATSSFTPTSSNTPMSVPTSTSTPAFTVTFTPVPPNPRIVDGVFGASHNVFIAGQQDVVFYYNVSETAHVQLSVYNVRGIRARKLVDEDKPPGVWSITWDGRNDQGSLVAPDVYFIIIRVGDRPYVRKIAVARRSP